MSFIYKSQDISFFIIYVVHVSLVSHLFFLSSIAELHILNYAASTHYSKAVQLKFPPPLGLPTCWQKGHAIYSWPLTLSCYLGNYTSK